MSRKRALKPPETIGAPDGSRAMKASLSAPSLPHIRSLKHRFRSLAGHSRDQPADHLGVRRAVREGFPVRYPFSRRSAGTGGWTRAGVPGRPGKEPGGTRERNERCRRVAVLLGEVERSRHVEDLAQPSHRQSRFRRVPGYSASPLRRDRACPRRSACPARVPNNDLVAENAMCGRSADRAPKYRS